MLVIEKHADFLRDFRGDTIHPSTLEVLHELGLLDDFLSRPHEEVRTITVTVGDTPITIGEFSSLPTHCKFIALMPQWDFLDFLADNAKPYPNFRLWMEAEAVGLLNDGGEVTGCARENAGRSCRGSCRIWLSVPTDAVPSCVKRPAS